jgi:glycerophosphoryl diester phosphodiesterase
MFDTFPDWRFVIELKARTPAVAQDLCAAVEQHGLTERVAIASFSGDALKSFRTACPQVLTTASFDEGLLFWVLHKLRLDDLYTPTPFGGFMVMPQLGPFTTIDERLMQTARRRNLAVQVWTINERAQMEKFIRLGVNGIMTDRPTQLLSLIEGGSTQ